MNRGSNLEAALKYQELGFSVIPVRHDKKPYIKWQPYQQQKPDAAMIAEWWRQYPDANIGLVTGEISGVDVVDADSDTGRDTLNEYLSDSLMVPTVKTPKGYHYYFRHTPGLSNGVRVITDCDLRTTGGYIIAPPSKNGQATYGWLDGLKITDIAPPAMPAMLIDVLMAGGVRISSEHTRAYIIDNEHLRGETVSSKTSDDTVTTFDDNDDIFTEGRRDNDLFNLTNDLVKAGMPTNKILKYLYFCASHCSPPFPENQIEAKINSALNRQENRPRNLTAEIRDFILTTSGDISTTDVYQVTTMTTSKEKRIVTKILSRMVQEGFIERPGNKNGVYRRVENECDMIDFKNATVDTVDIWLPFGLHELVEIMPGNTIIVAGSPNAGKTAFLLNIARYNMKKFNVHYFNSEMGANELRKRLENFEDIFLDDWCFHPWERSENFADVIRPGEGNINIIDFLEIYENFYEISGKLAAIHRKLKGAVAIVAIQKNPGTDAGIGGFRTLEKPRLALAMDNSILKIVKAKNWKSAENPNGKAVEFNIIDGSKLIQRGGWHSVDLKYRV